MRNAAFKSQTGVSDQRVLFWFRWFRFGAVKLKSGVAKSRRGQETAWVGLKSKPGCFRSTSD